MKYLFFSGLSIILLSCTTVYNYQDSNTYVLKRGNSIKKYSPKMIYYEVDYFKIEQLKQDTILYRKMKFEKQLSKKIKYKKDKREYFLTSIGEYLKLPEKIGDTVLSNCFLLRYLFYIPNNQNICDLNKYRPFSEKYEKYLYSFCKDTIIPTNRGQKLCYKYSIVFNNREFFQEHPFYFYIEKNTGVPLQYSYPFCSTIGDSNDIAVKYNTIHLYLEKRILFKQSLL